MEPVQNLYAALTEEGIEEARAFRRPPLRFRPSEASDCVRQIWFRLKGQRPAPRNAVSKIYGVNGDVDHDVCRQLFNHCGTKVHGVTYDEHLNSAEHMSVRTEMKVDLPSGGFVVIECSGRADGEIEVNGERMLLEIKTAGFYRYKWINSAWTDGFRSRVKGKMPPGMDALIQYIKEKCPSYYLQCQATMALTGFKKCYLVIVDRSTGNIGQWNEETGERCGIVLDFDPEVWEEIQQKFAYIKRKLNENDMPPAEFAQNSKECSWCPFYYACHGAAERRRNNQEPAVVYPGPQMEVYHDDPEGTSGGAERKDAQR